MANLDAPKGAVYMGSLVSGSAPAVVEYTHDASDANPIFVGDFVKLEADGRVAPADATDVLLGVCVQIHVDMDVRETEYPGYGPASTEVKVGVCIDPFATYEIQSSGTLAATDVGDNVEIVGTDGSVTTGLSAHEITATAVGATAQCRIIAVSPRQGNDISAANAKFIIMINENELRTAAGI